MACATLKRNLDSTMSMAQMPTKRRRCAPLAASSSTSPGIKMSQTSASSVFGETVSASAKYTPERMAQEICDEIMRLRRRRQLRLASGAAPSCSSSSGSEGDCSPQRQHSSKKVHHRALFTFKQVRAICERMLREQEAALRAEYNSVLHNKLDEQYASFLRFNIDQVQRRPPANACVPLGMDAEHHMHQDLVPSYLS